jgi:cation diffusion facilitator CzcD-associated flavoprotein CzcO
LFYQLARRRPAFAKRLIKQRITKELGAGYDVDRHFTPRYNPWDQRLCLVPNSDLFETIRDGKATIVTGEIDRFTETGVELASGEVLDADIIVAATGLNVKLAGGMELVVDGKPVALRDTIAYKGMMFCGIPNVTLALGYTNASWTLKCELTALYLCRLIEHVDRRGYAYCVPSAPGQDVGTEAAISLTSGYITRAASILPKQGTRAPWRLHQNYALDLASLRFGRLQDGVMEFARG